MVKTYLLNQSYNNATFTLPGDGGNQMQFTFRGGNVISHTLAFLTLENQYCQDVLENSELFKQGRVKFDPETAKAVRQEEARKKAEGAKKPAEPVVETKAEPVAEEDDKEYTLVGDVKTVVEAQNYVAEHFGESAKTAAQAKKIANENGVDFPNLKLGKGK